MTFSPTDAFLSNIVPQADHALSLSATTVGRDERSLWARQFQRIAVRNRGHRFGRIAFCASDDVPVRTCDPPRQSTVRRSATALHPDLRFAPSANSPERALDDRTAHARGRNSLPATAFYAASDIRSRQPNKD